MLQPSIDGLGMRARTEVAEGTRKETKDLYEVDANASRCRHKNGSEGEYGFLRHIQQAVGWG